MKKCIKFTSIILSAVFGVIYMLVVFGQIFLPKEITVYDPSENGGRIMKIYSLTETADNVVTASNTGSSKTAEAQVKLFGVIPVKNVKLTNTERRYVRPGGELIGIRLFTSGLIVVGLDDVFTSDGVVSPAEKAGIMQGDVITKLNGVPVVSTADFINSINSLGKDGFSVSVLRGNDELEFNVTPEYSDADGKYRCGLWLRDSMAGIGTMTFYDEKNSMMAALGHAICDSDTQSVLQIGSGDVLGAEITSIEQGKKGVTGQISGNFTDKKIGELYENNDFGIYGEYTCSFSETSELYPVAGQTEISTGKAQIISTVSNNGPEFYDIEIEKITYSDETEQRNMVIKITDETLLETTGGIVQGMSGSPIIQDGMFIGAVTHVFLNDPTRGYAVFAETMLSESDRIYSEKY